MKKYLILLSLLVVVLAPATQLNAQFRIFAEPVAGFDPDGNPTAPGENPIVDPFGNPLLPRCCENPSNGEFDFDLTFTDFDRLLFLESRLEQAARAAANKWLENQENETLLREMNRQMGTNYTSFSMAQREYFKFYEGGRNGNAGPVLKSNELAIRNQQWSKQWEKRTRSNIIKYQVLDDWIECGYCSEYEDLAYDLGNLDKYDNDNGPGPKFYAESERNGELNSFGKNLYTSALNNSRAIGFRKLAEGDFLLDRISSIRVDHYNRLGWQEKVLTMSAYLVNANTNCPLVTFSCLPNGLSEYKPPVVWNDNILLGWSKQFSPQIPLETYVFSDEYASQSKSYFVNLYGPYSWSYYKNNVDKTRRDVASAIFNIPDENKICSGIRWNDIGDAYYSTMTGLRLKSVFTFFGFQIGPEDVIPIPPICVETPNFERVTVRGRVEEVKIPSHRRTTQLKLAWQAAISALVIDERASKNPLTPAQYSTALLRNLNLNLQAFRLGSTATFGNCPGSVISNIKFCKD